MKSSTKWRLQVDNWIGIYGKLPNHTDATNLNVIYKKSCAKCKTIKGKFNRHHKGAEYILALLRPDLWARIYVSFSREDWEYLCERCHKNIERAYDRWKEEVFREWNNSWPWIDNFLSFSMEERKEQEDFLNHYRNIFITKFNRWLKDRRKLHRRKRIKK